MSPLRRKSPTVVSSPRHRVLTLSLAGVLLAGIPATARAESDPVKVAVQSDRANARLVLEWQHPVTYTVNRTGAYVFISFSRPVGAKLDAAQVTLLSLIHI